MCGIAGIWGNFGESRVAAMMAKMTHRGPDAAGRHVAGNLGALGHTRLAIMDPEGGDQPIYSHDGSVAVIANGEIYNYPQLRSLLGARRRWRTTSDSEAILHLYEEHGDDLVQKLDGMFAFALADGDRLLVARDPIGIKPLYFGKKGETYYFASEIKALHDWADEINEFPPGARFTTDGGIQKYYEVPDHKPEDLSSEESINLVRLSLEKAVAKRLMSDVPLGVFLSGGLDSSIIAAIVKQHMDKLHSFSVGFAGSTDLEAARRVADHLGTIHHEYVICREEMISKLPEIIYHLESFDQDLVRSAIPCYFTSRLASDYVKVILTGEGADELFAGYDYYKDIYDERILERELHRSVASLHNVNLQRVDRLTMAHSIEGRVPFLDLEMIETAQAIPARHKLFGEGRIEKWVLRKACEELLPEEIVWRRKEQFDEGSGTVDALSNWFADEDLSSARDWRTSHRDVGLRSDEEAYFHRLFKEAFPRNVVDAIVARWSDRPEDLGAVA
jgi:asparagine synthase (glutamine-hydrolysing)